MKVGEVFNPRNVFVGLFIPEGLAASTLFSSTAKLAYGHLVRRTGENGCCWPSKTDVAKHIGVKERAAQRALKELWAGDPPLIRASYSFRPDGSQTTNEYVFIWNPIFDRDVKNDTPPRVENDTPGGVIPDTQKVINRKSVRKKNGKDNEYDGSLRSRKNSASRPSVPVVFFNPQAKNLLGREPSTYVRGLTQREALREHLHGWGITADPPEDEMLESIMEAGLSSGAADVDAITAAIDSKSLCRLRERTRPKTYAWFVTVVANHFRAIREGKPAPKNDPDEDAARMECF